MIHEICGSISSQKRCHEGFLDRIMFGKGLGPSRSSLQARTPLIYRQVGNGMAQFVIADGVTTGPHSYSKIFFFKKSFFLKFFSFKEQGHSFYAPR